MNKEGLESQSGLKMQTRLKMQTGLVMQVGLVMQMQAGEVITPEAAMHNPAAAAARPLHWAGSLLDRRRCSSRP